MHLDEKKQFGPERGQFWFPNPSYILSIILTLQSRRSISIETEAECELIHSVSTALTDALLKYRLHEDRRKESPPPPPPPQRDYRVRILQNVNLMTLFVEILACAKIGSCAYLFSRTFRF